MFGYYNDYADPDLLYKGYNFNYYDIEDAMYEDFWSGFSDKLDDEIAWCGEETAKNTPRKPSTSTSARTLTLTSMTQLPVDISVETQRAGTTKCKPLSKGA
jgi:hypothetical protein